MISCVAYGLTGATVWLNTPKIPNAASSAVIARTSGTIDATNAPNVSSRMMNVSPIVTNVVSRLLLMRVVMSSLVSVELRVWTSKPLAAPSASMAEDRRPDRHEVLVDGVLVAGHRGDDADRGQVGGDEPGLGRRRRRVRDGVEHRHGLAVLGGRQALERRDRARDEGRERRVRDLQLRVRDDEQDVLGRRPGAALVEDGVGLRRFGLGLVGAPVRVLRADAAGERAEDEHRDRADEPGRGHRPPVARAPHRDPDGRGLPAPVRRVSHGGSFATLVVAVLDYLVASVTWVAPSALRSVTIPPFCSTVAGVWSAVRNAVSWSMTGCSHAFRVVDERADRHLVAVERVRAVVVVAARGARDRVGRERRRQRRARDRRHHGLLAVVVAGDVPVALERVRAAPAA